MVTVTESIMEDQKVTLNNIISEHVQANEILQKENKTILEEFENERKGFESKLQAQGNSLESLFKEMADIRHDKERFEKDIKVQKEASEKEKNKLEAKIQETESALESVFKEIHDTEIRPKKVNIVADIKKLKSDLQTKTVECKNLQEVIRNLTTTIQEFKNSK